MVVRYQRARLVMAAGLAASVIAGTAYFANVAPESSASNTSGGSTSTTVEAPRAKATQARRSRGS